MGATLSKVSMLIKLGKLSWDQPLFDYVIVDESSMATIPLTLIGILCGKRFILVGDHKQLPPITTPAASKYVKENWESLFRLLYDKYPQKHTLLDVQYRSNPVIMGFSSSCFYGGEILSAPGCENKNLGLSFGGRQSIVEVINNQPMICVDTYSASDLRPMGRVQSSDPNRSASYFNEYEAAVAVSVWSDLLSSGVNANNICVITPFKLQAQVLRGAMKKVAKELGKDRDVTDWHLAASTVHSFQGKEKEVVIYCFTWSPTYDGERLHIALRDFRELNVALTRASEKLILVGSISTLNEFPYSALAQYCKKGSLTIQCPKIEKDNKFLRLVNDCFRDRGRLQAEEMREDSFAKKKPVKIKSETPAKTRNADFEMSIVTYYLKMGMCASEIAEKKGIPIERVKELKDKIEGAKKPVFNRVREPEKTKARSVISHDFQAKRHNREQEIRLNKAKSFMINYKTATDLQVAAETGFTTEEIKQLRQKLQNEGLIENSENEQNNTSIDERQTVGYATCPYCDLKVREAQLEKHIRSNHI